MLKSLQLIVRSCIYIYKTYICLLYSFDDNVFIIVFNIDRILTCSRLYIADDVYLWFLLVSIDIVGLFYSSCRRSIVNIIGLSYMEALKWIWLALPVIDLISVVGCIGWSVRLQLVCSVRHDTLKQKTVHSFVTYHITYVHAMC
jgi:hypothetical protein